MPTYVHKCVTHGVFEERRSILQSGLRALCPKCQTPCDKAVSLNRPQILVPAHFRTTLPLAGLKDGQGRSGDYENLGMDFNRWNSGCSGPRDYSKIAAQQRAKANA